MLKRIFAGKKAEDEEKNKSGGGGIVGDAATVGIANIHSYDYYANFLHLFKYQGLEKLGTSNNIEPTIFLVISQKSKFFLFTSSLSFNINIETTQLANVLLFYLSIIRTLQLLCKYYHITFPLINLYLLLPKLRSLKACSFTFINGKYF